jgi:hypothetical protein
MMPDSITCGCRVKYLNRVQPSGRVQISERSLIPLCHHLALVAEHPVHRGKGDLVHRQLVPIEQLDFQALLADAEQGGARARVHQFGAPDQLDLAQMRDGIDGQQVSEFEIGQRLFARLAPCAVLGCFIEFEIAGRHGPEAAARFDGAAAQKHLALMPDHRAHHNARVLVIDEAAGGADIAFMGVAIGNDALE